MLHADTVGSLLRPPELLAARDRWKRGELDEATLRAVEDDAIRGVVALQEEIGLPVVTDGEFRRENWWIDFVSKLKGVTIEEGRSAAFQRNAATPEDDHGHDHGDYVPKRVVTRGRVHAEGPVTVEDFRFTQSLCERPAKITLPSPTRMHFHGGRNVVSQEVYPDLERFFDDVAKLYQGEIAALEDAGCRYIQIDDPLLAYFISPRMRAEVQADGDDPDERLVRYIKLINDCVSKRKETTTIGLHICRGNARSLALSEGPYDGIAEQCFGHLAVDRFLLEYDDVHAGGFEPLRFMQPGKQVVLGLVTTKRPDLENKDALKRRVDEATRFIEAERLAISPQCGFASVVEGNAVTLEDEIAKLKLVVETAHELWGD